MFYKRKFRKTTSQCNGDGNEKTYNRALTEWKFCASRLEKEFRAKDQEIKKLKQEANRMNREYDQRQRRLNAVKTQLNTLKETQAENSQEELQSQIEVLESHIVDLDKKLHEVTSRHVALLLFLSLSLALSPSFPPIKNTYHAPLFTGFVFAQAR